VTGVRPRFTPRQSVLEAREQEPELSLNAAVLRIGPRVGINKDTSLVAALGWDPTELVGRRVVTVIPPASREARVAGFSRHLSTGEAHVIAARSSCRCSGGST
jgi:hypothetical protein